jgi:hypothetical protein
MRSMRVSRLPPSAMRPCAPGPEDAESTDGYGQRGRERCADRPEERPADRFARCPAADLAFQAAGSLGRLCVFPGRWRLCCCAEGRLTFPLGQPAHWAHRAACPEQGRWVAGGDGYRRIRTARIGGREGRLFSIYWGQVSADSDGPVEWRKPVPPPRPKNSRSSSPSWADAQGIDDKQFSLTPEDLGVQITYLTRQPSKTECDFAVPSA